MIANCCTRLISQHIRRNLNACCTLLKRSDCSALLAPALHQQSATFKSDISIDTLYPSSNPDYLTKNKLTEKLTDNDGQNFSGYIPIDELTIRTSKSSGPGGQNVNKVNSKVEVRFHLHSATWIPEWIKPRLAAQEEGRITKDGFLVVRSDMSRKQLLNQADCMNKLRKMIYDASSLPREPTMEEVKLRESRTARAKAGVLREKRNRSIVKKSRSMPEF